MTMYRPQTIFGSNYYHSAAIFEIFDIRFCQVLYTFLIYSTLAVHQADFNIKLINSSWKISRGGSYVCNYHYSTVTL
jgi:hypothetical protein